MLVADFGGGTTDYSVIRFETHGGKLKATPIGHSGVGIAGDHFDYRMIDNVVAPRSARAAISRASTRCLKCHRPITPISGAGTSCRSSRRPREFAGLKTLVRTSLEPEKLETFVDLVEHDEGYPLYQAVSATKMALSTQEEAEFISPPLGPGGHRSIRRVGLRALDRDDLRRIEDALDDVLLKTNMQERDIDKVFLTGGTSFVPAVRRIFTERFDQDRIETGGELLSIAHGLALIGERDDIAQWTA